MGLRTLTATPSSRLPFDSGTFQNRLTDPKTRCLLRDTSSYFIMRGQRPSGMTPDSPGPGLRLHAGIANRSLQGPRCSAGRVAILEPLCRIAKLARVLVPSLVLTVTGILSVCLVSVAPVAAPGAEYATTPVSRQIWSATIVAMQGLIAQAASARAGFRSAAPTALADDEMPVASTRMHTWSVCKFGVRFCVCTS
ncbi:hypothetical protein IF2G_08548 [Cordyceps javanica]|nr:hypothetical protein IF2G_08548 [Cordyceps javanica]